MSAHAFSFRAQEPAVTLNLLTPDLLAQTPTERRVTLLVDTGFSDYLQLDWDTFLALDLQQHAVGTIESKLADGSSVTDLVALSARRDSGVRRRCRAALHFQSGLWRRVDVGGRAFSQRVPRRH